MENLNQRTTGAKIGDAFESVCRTTKYTSEKFQSCFDARLASMIAGIVMSIVFGAGVLVCILGLVYVVVITSFGYSLDAYYVYPDRKLHIYQVTDILVTNAFITLGLVLSLMEFSFAAVLAHGACKSIVEHLRAYLIYANIKSAALFVTAIILYIVVWDNLPGSLTLLYSALNVVLTVVVYMAYKKIKECTKGYSKIDAEAPAQE